MPGPYGITTDKQKFASINEKSRRWKTSGGFVYVITFPR